MKLIYRCCAGLDVHRDSVNACVRKRVQGQAEPVIEEQVFATYTQDLERLRSWLRSHKVRQVAMESTGVYWRPVWNVLEGGKRPLALMLVNPATVRALQGTRRTASMLAASPSICNMVCSKAASFRRSRFESYAS